MNKLKKLNIDLTLLVKEFSDQSAAIQQQKVALVKRRVIKCTYCRKGSHMGRWSFVQDHWYTPPHGCTEGSYWNDSETKNCHLSCPKCSAMNYIFNHPQREQIIDLVDGQGVAKKDVFSTIWDRHGNNEPQQVYPEP